MAYDPEKDKILADQTLAWNGENKIVAKIVQYGKGEPKLQIQEYYTKDKGESFNPGKALHRMPMEAAYSLVENLSKFLDEYGKVEPAAKNDKEEAANET
ncbi:MAG: hypothetical protein AB1489_25190 [Acidobacteriota bacterium]